MNDSIQLAHGGGGLMTRDFVRAEVLTRFGSSALKSLPDAATLSVPGRDIVFTSDSFVVSPLEFPGGNIGSLAVHGSVNDVAVAGGMPLWLSLCLIMEEGLPRSVLGGILDSVSAAAGSCGIEVVTGDTKVVERGKCDRLYINTACIGRRLENFNLSTDNIHPGDMVLVSGPVGDHGMAVMAVRAGIDLSDGPRSDSGPVHRLVLAAQPFAKDVRFMRDPTRGGVAAVLNEAMEKKPADIVLREDSVPVSPKTRAITEMLGVDPLHSACEGRVILICGPGSADAILGAWRKLPEGAGAAQIGEVTSGRGMVLIETITGSRRIVDVPRGELLPRIC
ncbi:MAG: hydrogenase expression/formation protein HypE [bacterium]